MMSRRQKVQLVWLTFCLTVSLGVATDSALGKNKSKDAISAEDVFSAPPAMAETPIFVNRDGSPLKPRAADNIDDNDINLVQRIPDLTSEQRKVISKMISDARSEMALMREGVKKLDTELKTAQATKDGEKKAAVSTPAPPDLSIAPTIMSAAPMLQQSPDDIKASIQSTNNEIKKKNLDLMQSVLSKLTPQQQDELAGMHRGKLIITSSTRSSSDLAADTAYSTDDPKEAQRLEKTLIKKAINAATNRSVYQFLKGI